MDTILSYLESQIPVDLLHTYRIWLDDYDSGKDPPSLYKYWKATNHNHYVVDLADAITEARRLIHAEEAALDIKEIASILSKYTTES